MYSVQEKKRPFYLRGNFWLLCIIGLLLVIGGVSGIRWGIWQARSYEVRRTEKVAPRVHISAAKLAQYTGAHDHAPASAQAPGVPDPQQDMVSRFTGTPWAYRFRKTGERTLICGVAGCPRPGRYALAFSPHKPYAANTTAVDYHGYDYNNDPNFVGNDTLPVKGVVNLHRGTRMKLSGNPGDVIVLIPLKHQLRGSQVLYPSISWRIGSDIRPGLYQMTLTATDSDPAGIEVDGGLTYLKPHPQKKHQFNSVTVALHRGQKIKNDAGVLCFKKLTPIKHPQPLVLADSDYQIGKDLPAGRYRIIAEHGKARVKIEKENGDEVTTKKIKPNGKRTSVVVTLHRGETLEEGPDIFQLVPVRK